MLLALAGGSQGFAQLMSRPYSELSTQEFIVRMQLETEWNLENLEATCPDDPVLQADIQKIRKDKEAREQHNELIESLSRIENELRNLER
jgi:hypothetical protein